MVTEELCSVCEIVGVCVCNRRLAAMGKTISFDSTEKSNEFRVTWRLDSLLHYCKYPRADWLFPTQTEQHVLFHFTVKKFEKCPSRWHTGDAGIKMCQFFLKKITEMVTSVNKIADFLKKMWIESFIVAVSGLRTGRFGVPLQSPQQEATHHPADSSLKLY